MPVYELRTQSATFGNDMKGNEHFFIDCGCGGGFGGYAGSFYLNGCEAFQNSVEESCECRGNLAEHTFYATELLFRMELEEHREEAGDEPLVIVCRDCGKEFPFTYESFEELKGRMEEKYAGSA